MTPRRSLSPLLVLLVLPLAAAQGDPHAPDPNGYSFRAVLGDDPATRDVAEDAARFHVREVFAVVNRGQEPLASVQVFLPSGADLVVLRARNGTLEGQVEEGDVTADGRWLTYRYPGNESVPPGGRETGFTFRYALAAAVPEDLEFVRRGVPQSLPSYSFLVLVPDELAVRGTPPMEALDVPVYPGYSAYTLDSSPGDAFALRLDPAPGTTGPGAGADRNWLLIGVAFVAGAVIAWGLATARKPRKPTRAETMAARGVPELEARRRVLMAALKELELAHRSGEISADAYNPLKAELKGETVKVMTELERRQAAEAKA